MARDVLEIGVDAGQAHAELDALASEFRQLRQTTQRAGEQMSQALTESERSADSAADAGGRLRTSFSAVGSAMQGAAILVTGLNQALSLVSRGFEFGRRALEGYLRETKEGDAIWESVERRLRSIRGMLVAAALGTDDLEEGSADLARIFGVVVGALEQLAGGFSLSRGEAEKFVRDALVVAVDVAIVAVDAFGALEIAWLRVRQAGNALSLGFLRLGEGIASVVGFIANSALRVFAALLDGVSEVAGTLGSVIPRQMGGAVGQIRDALQSVEEGSDDFAGSVRGLSTDIETFQRAVSSTADTVASELNDSTADAQARIAEVNERTERWTTSLRILQEGIRTGATDAVIDFTAAIESASSSIEEQISLLQMLRDLAIKGADERIDAELREADFLAAKAERRAAIAQAAIETDLAKQAQASAQAIAIEQAQTDALIAQRDKLAAESARLHDEEEERDRRREESMRDVASTTRGAMSAIIAGEKSLAEVARELAAQKIGDLGEEAFVESLLMFARGNIPGGIAMAAASAAAFAASAKLGGAGGKGGAGPVSAGAAAPAPVQQQVISQTTTIVNNNPVASREDIARGIGPMVGLAMRRGHVQMGVA